MEQFTASEVRELAKHMESVGWQPDSNGDPDCCDEGAARSSEMLFAFADLLEAREKAVPVVTRESAINALAHVGQHNGPGRETEARQMLVEGSPSATHSAQAHPPAASVTDAMVERAQDCLHDKGKDIGYYHMRAALEAALAAQENPNG